MTATHESHKAVTWPIWLLAAPAAVAIWAGWVELGEMCGYGRVRPLPGIADDFIVNSAVTLPVGVEAYAAIALRTALNPGTPCAARTFAKRSAVAALVLGMAGQIAYHVMAAAGLTQAPWWVTAVVACLPVLVLGAGAALAHLLVHGTHHNDHTPEPAGTASSVAPQRITATPQSNLAITTPDDVPSSVQTSPARPAPKKRGAGRATKTTTATAGGGGSKAERARAVAAEHPGWTQEQVAQVVGCTARTVRRALAAGAADPTPAESVPVFELPLGPVHHEGLVFSAPLGPNQHTTEKRSVATSLREVA